MWTRSAESSAGIERTIGVESGAIVLLSVVVGFVGLVVVGQMLRRHVEVDEVEALTWGALGWGRADTVRLAIVRGASFGAASTALAIAVAVGLSPLFPVGIGRIADPDVGWHARQSRPRRWCNRDDAGGHRTHAAGDYPPSATNDERRVTAAFTPSLLSCPSAGARR